MLKVEKSMDVHASADVAYRLWNENFPSFLQEIKSCEPSGEHRFRLCAEVMGQTYQWVTEVDERPQQHEIQWHSVSGRENRGKVSFEEAAPGFTRVHLEMSFQPESAIEHMIHRMGYSLKVLKADLERFKSVVESH